MDPHKFVHHPLAEEPRTPAGHHGSVREAAALARDDVPFGILFLDNEKLCVDRVYEPFGEV